MPNQTSEKDQRALAHLQTAFGQPGSGRLRYAAAMYFNRQGLISDDALEVYRICSADDAEDPATLLSQRGIKLSLLPERPIDPALRLRLLVEEVDRYLGELAGPGVAEVRSGIARHRHGDVKLVPPPANALVGRYLETALSELSVSHPALAAVIAETTPHLKWITYDEYPPEKIGEGFLHNHAFAPLIGHGAPIPAKEFDLGLFLISPHILYRDHYHPAPELYAPLTGPHGWRFGPDQPLIIKPAHEPVWNEPLAPHMTKVGPTPFLCIYGWTRDVEEIAHVIPANDWPELEALHLGT